MARLGKVATARQAQLNDGRRLGFAEYGDPTGKAVFMMHDLPGTRLYRHPDDSIINKLGIRLIGVDRPGIGLSTRKPNRSLLAFADDIALLAQGLNIDRFSVLGHSAGAPYALACAYKLSEQVSRCAIVGALPPMDNPQGFQAINSNFARLYQLAATMPGVLRLFMRGFWWLDIRRASDYYIRELVFSMPPVDRQIMNHPALLSLMKQMWEEIRQSGSDGYVDEMIALTGSWGFKLDDISVPVDIWWGESDTFTAPLIARKMAEFIPNHSLHIEAGAGHLMLFSHWQAILQQLLD